jgi:chromosome partition protein MukF
MTATFPGFFPRRNADDTAAEADASVDRPPSVARTIADAYHTEARLDLSREDISFVAGIYMYLRLAEEPNLDDATLRSIYVPLNELVNGDPESMQQRCTRAVARLKLQSILVRADYRGISSSGEFSLTSLGYAIADFVLRESNLTVQSLELLLSRIRTELARVIDAARQGGDSTYWANRVLLPLQLVVSDLIDSIERRTRGLDKEHGILRQNIRSLFEQEWLEAVDICTDMLESVSRTLGELNAVLNEHVESLNRQLGEIADLADNHTEILPTLDTLGTQLNRIHAWSVKRYDEWSEYFADVNQWIRMIIRIDPENRIRDRIRDCIQHYSDRPYGMVTVNPAPFLHFREVVKPDRVQQIPVPASVLAKRTIREVGPPVGDDIDAVIEALLRRLEDDGAIDLVQAILDEASHLTDAQWFTLISRATPILLKRGLAPTALAARRWIDMSARLAAQALTIRARRPARDSTSPTVLRDQEGRQSWPTKK